jgi:uncharacterized protein
VLLAVLIIPSAFAIEGHIPLLALSENETGFSGSVADLELRITEGGQRVFLETIPLTRVATQISVRFAQQIACRELGLDCTGRDFLYTIQASSGIIGGPSAGAAATVLTAALLLNLTLRNDTVITGTINSGGFIGPVGGLRYKLEAAAARGYRRALIPRGLGGLVADGLTVNLSVYARDIGLELHEVGMLEEALELFTGYRPARPSGDIIIAPRYQEVMREVREELCGRTADALREAEQLGVPGEALELPRTLINRSMAAHAAGAEYASASYCFRTGVLLRQEIYLAQGLSAGQLRSLAASLEERRGRAEEAAEGRPLATMTDLQTYIAVRERLAEAEGLLGEVAALIDEGDLEGAGRTVAFAEERVFSAESWSAFFDGQDVRFILDEARLRSGCGQRIGEAEERLAYVQLELPGSLENVEDDLRRAHADFDAGRYVLCLGAASIAKARADLVLSLAGARPEDLAGLLDLKLAAAHASLLRTLEKGIFPMLAYSYYEYARSLQGFDDQFGLLFAEYALELSSLDLYLGPPVPAPASGGLFMRFSAGLSRPVQVVLALLALAVLALLAGLALWLAFRKRRKPRKRHR